MAVAGADGKMLGYSSLILPYIREGILPTFCRQPGLLTGLFRFCASLLLMVAGIAAGTTIAHAQNSPCRTDGSEQLHLQHCVKALDGLELKKQLASHGLSWLAGGNWYRIDLSASAGERWLDLGIPDAYRVQVSLVQNGQVNTVLDLDQHSNFSDRPVQDRSLIASLVLLDGPASVYVFYQSHSRTPMFARLLTMRELIISNSLSNLFSGLIFGIMLASVPILSLGFRARHQRGFRLYSAMAVSNILFIAQVEGYLFAFLWPQAPAWNMRAPAVLGLLTALAHIVFVVNFLHMKKLMPRLYRLHQFMFAAALLTMFLHLLFVLDTLVVALTLSYTLIACYNAVQGMRHRIGASGYYLLGVISLAAFPLMLLIFSISGINPFPALPLLAYPKFAYLGETLLFGAAVVSQLRQFNAKQSELRVRRLEETEQLLRAEQEKLQALNLAQEQQLKLASASHDMVQPLASLRFALTALEQQRAPLPLTEHIDHTLSYVQAMLNDLIEQAQIKQHVPEHIDLDNMLFELERTFLPVAREKGLRLSVRRSKLRLPGSSLLLYRILSNLLANALRYTDKGRVLLGIRRRANGIDIQLFDTGPGIPRSIEHQMLQAFRQEKVGEGFGLGLFIVKNLCQQCNYQLHIRSEPGRGSCFAIHIPHDKTQ